MADTVVMGEHEGGGRRREISILERLLHRSDLERLQGVLWRRHLADLSMRRTFVISDLPPPSDAMRRAFSTATTQNIPIIRCA